MDDNENKKLILFYSYGGNTRGIANKIKEKLDADIVEIETAFPYTGDYNSVVEQGHREINSHFKPEIKPLGIDLKDYDTIILGTPTWWYTMAPAMLTFLSENDLSRKKIIPFETNGGWIGHTFKDIRSLCPNSEFGREMDITFQGNRMETPTKKLDEWIDSIK
ncbi:MAG: hypothetical protein LUE88_02410 [Clostridiales bacterium]|nr:hypothetical protein [Clostridiales bacterium]